MEKSENAVRSRLLEAGKEEFRDRGFLKASLRAICKKADVTTGALYFFFESKAALFEDQEKQLHPEEYDRILMEFIWENRDIAKILIDGAEGTRYVNFREDACTKMEQILNERFQKECGQEVDHELVHILVQMKFQGYCELLRGNCSREKLLEISRILQICSSQCLLAIEAELNRKH